MSWKVSDKQIGSFEAQENSLFFANLKQMEELVNQTIIDI